MPNHLSSENIQALLNCSSEEEMKEKAKDLKIRIEFSTVFIAGSGPVGCTYARLVLDQYKEPDAVVMMAEIGSQDHPVVGAHHKNSIKYQKDIDAFVNVIKGALQPISVPPTDPLQTTLAGAAWHPPLNPEDGVLVIQGHNPNQKPGVNLRASAVTRTVGGMATHWTCACPLPHEEERVHCPIDKAEFDGLLGRAGQLLNVHDDQYDNAIRHTVVKERLGAMLPEERGLRSLPLAVQRRTDNPDYVTWTGSDTILGEAAKDPRFKLKTETRVTRLISNKQNPRKVSAVLTRDLNTNEDVLIIAKAYVITCGAIGTPQILWNSGIRPPALGRHLTLLKIVLLREIVDRIPFDPRFEERVERHRERHPSDPLPIPFNDPEPQVNLPYTAKYPWHVQIHRDAFSYGDVGPKADPRVVVDLRFFGKGEIRAENRVTFGKEGLREGDWRAGVTDIYGMPQPTFHVERTKDDGDRDQRMMEDMTAVASMLGGYLPDSYPQFMEPGLALHITGTIRVGKDPENSVADPNSRVHGFDDLWVGGNGCIPDATASNPTRTSVAYAIRGAEAIVAHLRQP
ncbi:Pyranose 2-oxidase [Marasmius crinis-equi]|uniref:Pyranose 2-oxidase n=1 Tax=Marasmius crinis-equi TaxID=585013 RepID=A0ABR3F4J3_9AGAR